MTDPDGRPPRQDEHSAAAEGAPAESAIRAALADLLASPTFRSAPQLASFLNYIVSATLAGRSHEIKGYTIAVEALGRPDDFDPVADPIVRVEAGRLRRALEHHYATDGAADSLRIKVLRGSYVPQFAMVQPGVDAPAAEAAPAPALTANPLLQPLSPPLAADRGADRTLPDDRSTSEPAMAFPSPHRMRNGSRLSGIIAALAVLVALGVAGWGLVTSPGRKAGQESAQLETTAARTVPILQVEALPANTPELQALTQQFTESLTDALSRFDEFVTLDHADRPPAAAAASPPDSAAISYKLEYRAQAAGRTIGAAMRLLHMPSGRVVWATSVEHDDGVLHQVREVREMARRVVVRLAQPYGVIHADLRSLNLADTPMACLIATYDYWTNPTEKRHGEVRGCLERIVRNEPLFHPAHALLAMIHLDEFRIGYNAREGSALERARAEAQRAVSLAPESARALQALMAVQTVSGETEAAIKTGFEAVRRNPFDTDILADLGARLTQAGRAREGRPLLLRAADLNMARPPWHDFFLYLSAREIGDAEGARTALLPLTLVEAPLALLARAVAAADAGARDEALKAVRRLSSVSPVFERDAGLFLDRAFFAPEVRAMLLNALRRAGLDQPGRG